MEAYMETPKVEVYEFVQFLKPATCSNSENLLEKPPRPICRQKPTITCDECKIVQYCSQSCQKLDHEDHASICTLFKEEFVPEWSLGRAEMDKPKEGVGDAEKKSDSKQKSYGKKSDSNKRSKSGRKTDDTGKATTAGDDRWALWGTEPAIDVLKISSNDEESNRDLKLLFAASGDLHNVIKTVVEGLPEDYTGRCDIHINDANFQVVARNIILLSLATKLDAPAAVPMMLHLWYSAFVPACFVEVLRAKIAPEYELGYQFALNEIRRHCSKTLRYVGFMIKGNAEFPCILPTLEPEGWRDLRGYCKPPKDLTTFNAVGVRIIANYDAKLNDERQAWLSKMDSPMRVAMTRFRDCGIMLPHGTPRRDFDTPNPTLFRPGKPWPIHPLASPFDGWNYQDCVRFTTVASNDVMGGLFNYLEDLLWKFCQRIRKLKICFHMTQVPAEDLGRYLLREKHFSTFDRIEVSNLCDRSLLGPEVIFCKLGRYLKPVSINPRATLLLFFQHAVREAYGRSLDLNVDGATPVSGTKLMGKLVGINDEEVGCIMERSTQLSHRHLARVEHFLPMFSDLEQAFSVFCKEVGLEKLANNYGLRTKKSTLVKPWPLRPHAKMEKDEFEMLHKIPRRGYERYVEMEKFQAEASSSKSEKQPERKPGKKPEKKPERVPEKKRVAPGSARSVLPLR